VSKSTRCEKPSKPYAAFPLFQHASGRWAKKIRSKHHFFGRWGVSEKGVLRQVDDVAASAAEALERPNREWPYLSQGRTPPTPGSGSGCEVKTLCNAFLTVQKRKLESNDIAERTFGEDKNTTDRIVAEFGKDRLVEDLVVDDFERLRALIAQRWGPVRLGNAVQRVRSMCKYGFEAGLLTVPVRFGPQFKRPSKSVLRRHKTKLGHAIQAEPGITLQRLKAQLHLSVAISSLWTTLRRWGLRIKKSPARGRTAAA
jgi:hypothetical protein